MKYLLLSFLCIATICDTKAQIITTIAGTGTPGYNGDNVQATLSEINDPYQVTTDKAGNIYIADHANQRVRKVALNGVITTVAGNGAGGYSGDGGLATSASLYYPEGVVVDSLGNIYISDNGNSVIRKVATNGIISTIAGTHTGGFSGDGGPATSAELYNPGGIFLDGNGNLFIADLHNNCIRKIDKNGIITTVAGKPSLGAGYNGDGVPATSAQLNNPFGVAVDIAGNIYIGDNGNNRVRKVATSGIISTYAGTGTAGFGGDGGAAAAAEIFGPASVILDKAGDLLFLDGSNNRIRKVTPNGIISTIAGTGVAGFSGDGGPATSAELNVPIQITVDPTGNIIFSDRGNNRIREISAAVAPTITSFNPTTGGTGSIITINGTGFLGTTAVKFGGTAATSFTIVSATQITAKVGGGTSGNVTVTTPAGTATRAGFTYCLVPSVKITADVGSGFCAGTVVTFTANPKNEGTAPVYQWQKNKVNVGTNSQTYVDSTLKTGDSIRCILTSNASPCVTLANVTSNVLTFNVKPILVPAVSIADNPSAPVCAGTKVQFSAVVTNGGTSPAYQWKKNGVNVGIDSLGYSDNLLNNGDSIVMVLTSNAVCQTTNTTSSNVIKVIVNVPHPDITIVANKDTSICSGTNVTFTATVTPSYLWRKNGVSVGTNSNTYADASLKSGDNIQCLLVSSATACNTYYPNIVNSNKLVFKVNTVPAKPSAITGPSAVSSGQSGIYFSVTAVPSVMNIWTLPTGATIDSGQGGNLIKVTWGSTAGNVSVIASNSCGSSATASTKAVSLSPSTVFKAGATTDEAVAGDDKNIRIYPNPAGSHTNLVFTVTKPGKYVVTIADAQNNVLEIKNGISVKGSNTISINTGKYAKGVYFITVIDKENGQRAKQLVIGE